jgi:hypothetical protein
MSAEDLGTLWVQLRLHNVDIARANAIVTSAAIAQQKASSELNDIAAKSTKDEVRRQRLRDVTSSATSAASPPPPPPPPPFPPSHLNSTPSVFEPNSAWRERPTKKRSEEKLRKLANKGISQDTDKELILAVESIRQLNLETADPEISSFSAASPVGLGHVKTKGPSDKRTKSKKPVHSPPPLPPFPPTSHIRTGAPFDLRFF